MRRLRIVILCLFAASALVASGKGVLPCMVYRYGLTNEQIDDILTRHPDAELRITAQDWRGMRYELSRFQCMTNYVNLIGSTQDCARVLLQLHDTAESWRSRHGAVSNLYVRTARELEQAADRAREYADAFTDATNRLAVSIAGYTDATNRLAASIADYMSASNRAARAEARHDAIVSWAEEQRDKVISPLTKAIWQAFIDRLRKDDDD